MSGESVGRRVARPVARIGIVLLGTALLGPAIGQPAASEPVGGCDGWRLETVASGLDEPENLEPDGHGGFYVSGATTLSQVDARGSVSVLHEGLPVPRGLQLVDGRLYMVMGDGISVMDVATGQLTGLVDVPGAHGLLALPDGDLLTTWVGTDVLAPSPGMTRIDPESETVTPHWAPVPRSEGVALGPDHRFVYTDDLFTGEIIRVPLADPDRWEVVARLPGPFPGPDDLTMSTEGLLYVAAHLDGSIQQVDPSSGTTCAIASDLPSGWSGPSSVRIGEYSDRFALYVTVFDGTLRRLVPPDDVALTPVG